MKGFVAWLCCCYAAFIVTAAQPDNTHKIVQQMAQIHTIAVPGVQQLENTVKSLVKVTEYRNSVDLRIV